MGRSGEIWGDLRRSRRQAARGNLGGERLAARAVEGCVCGEEGCRGADEI